MSKLKHPRLLDVVGVLNDANQAGIEIGDVGTVVEILPPDGLEVEFVNRDGRTERIGTLRVADVLVLNREKTPVS